MYIFTCYAGFRYKVTSYNEQPNVHFMYETLVIMTTNVAGSYVTWSTLQNYNQLEMDHLRIPTLQVQHVFVSAFDMVIGVTLCCGDGVCHHQFWSLATGE